ncbi:YjcZ family sporulation protein [Paenibacillus sp. P96]|uniref:YjcZ family sporulation protein n=1 Tax=Paenibacillus zeirhizosphaerae TaxID=2987519 RepID=A0ABT9FLI6_9BACL|nr:YjcZ family sporulation protein [Paenibacillus sp. P96]MDP4095599.1 YjcZ family sporulation protein [Paenibacillus sp. P96]
MSACKGVGYGAGYGAGYGGVWTSTGVILVLFILLVIISRTFFI